MDTFSDFKKCYLPNALFPTSFYYLNFYCASFTPSASSPSSSPSSSTTFSSYTPSSVYLRPYPSFSSTPSPFTSSSSTPSFSSTSLCPHLTQFPTRQVSRGNNNNNNNVPIFHVTASDPIFISRSRHRFNLSVPLRPIHIHIPQRRSHSPSQ